MKTKLLILIVLLPLLGSAQGWWGAVPGAATVDLKTDLVSHYEFNQTTGSTLVDSYGTNDLSIYGAAINETGFGNLTKCFSFDGSDFVYKTSTSISEIKTFSVWWYNDVEITGSSSREVLYCVYNGTPYNNLDLGSATSYLVNETMTMTGGGASLRTGIKDNISVGWHHTWIEWNGSTYDFYLDNVQKTAYTGSQGDADIFAANQIYIGVAKSSSYAGYFTGKIAQVSFWSASKGADARTAVYGSGNGYPYINWQN